MPQVPRPQGQTVAPSGFQPLQHIEAPAGAFGGEIAQALKGAGQTAQDISAQLVAHDKYMTGLANKADSDHYGSQYTEQSYALQADFETNQRGGNAKPAMPEYIKKLADLRAANRKDLNPAAAAMYDADTDHTTRNIISAMTSHTVTQQKTYEVNSSVAREKTSGDGVIANPGNPDFEATYLATSEKEGRFRGAAAGMDIGEDTTYSDRAIKEERGKVFSQAADNLATTNVTAAQAYLTAHKDVMGDDAYVKAMARMQPRIDAHNQANDADAAVAQALAIRPDTSGRVAPEDNALAKDYLSGIAGGEVTITSGRRTEADQERLRAEGYKPSDTSEHMTKYGTAYDLTPPKGMTTAQLAEKLKAADTGAHQIIDEGDHVHIGWANSNPNKASVNSATGGPLTSQEIEDRALDVIALARKQAEKTKPGDQLYADGVVSRAITSFNQQFSATKHVEDSAATDILAVIEQGDIQSKDELFATNPAVAQQYNMLPANVQKRLATDMSQKANEWTAIREQNVNTVNLAWTERGSNPKAYLDLNIPGMDLRRTDKIQLLKQQEAFRNKPQAVVDKNWTRMKQDPNFQGSIKDLGLKPSSPSYQHFLGAVNAELGKWEEANPGKVPDAKANASIIAQATRITGSTYREIPLIGWEIPGTRQPDPTQRAFGHKPADIESAKAFLRSRGQPDTDYAAAQLLQNSPRKGTQ